MMPAHPEKRGRKHGKSSRRDPARLWTVLAAAILTLALLAGAASAAEPLKIGFGMALTGGLAGTGKAALLATKMWAEDSRAVQPARQAGDRQPAGVVSGKFLYPY
jgi:hypothetical protein